MVIKKNGHRGSDDAPQGCKPALDQEVRCWLPQPGCRGICSADAPQGCKPALQGCNLHLTKHLRLDRAQLMRHKDANLHLTKKCGTGFQVFRNQSTYLSLLMRHNDANLHLTKKCGTGFQKAISRMSLYNCSCYHET